MSRVKKLSKKRILKADPVYRSPLVSRFVNKMMVDGKKSLAQLIFYGALGKLSENKKDALEVLRQAVENVSPKLEVRPRRVGGATYQVPGPVRHDRAEALALRWLLESARARKGKPMVERLVLELTEAAANQGNAVKKRETMHRLAEANRAFAHFRW